jgi:hypothetical protein
VDIDRAAFLSSFVLLCCDLQTAHNSRQLENSHLTERAIGFLNVNSFARFVDFKFPSRFFFVLVCDAATQKRSVPSSKHGYPREFQHRHQEFHALWFGWAPSAYHSSFEARLATSFKKLLPVVRVRWFQVRGSASAALGELAFGQLRLFVVRFFPRALILFANTIKRRQDLKKNVSYKRDRFC